MKKILILILLLLAASLCITPSVAAPGFLQLKITDDVENITSLVLNINEIRVHRPVIEIIEEPVNQTNETQGNETNQTDNAGWITVFSGPRAIDLITVKNVEELLAETTLDAGKSILKLD